MLVERVFLIGGLLCLAAGVLFLGDLIAVGALSADPILGVPGAMFVGFGILFVYVSAQAARDRRALLALGERGSEGRAPAPGAPPHR
jgi:hypothetical protein